MPVMGGPRNGDESQQQVHTRVRKIGDLLRMDLRIPEYQRPYKWTIRHVDQLLEDLDSFRKYDRYRIGTVILHHNRSGALDVVDGQQRFITFNLIAHCLLDKGQDIPLTGDLQLPAVGMDITRKNLLDNHRHLLQALKRYRGRELQAWTDFFLNGCEVVLLTLNRVDEAFQMFDSQNTRGRALFPTDLLKAFHIREMSLEHTTPELRQAMVERWEAILPASVNELFSDYLFKIKRWASGKSVPTTGFSIDYVDEFKGVRESDKRNAHNRWAMPHLYAKNYVDDHQAENRTLIRFGAMSPVEYPFQIDQPIINGETFFLMVEHYYQLAMRCGLFDEDPTTETPELIPSLTPILSQLQPFKDRATHQLVRNLFDCLVLYYVDRFSDQEIEQASELFARYAMGLRVQQRQVRRVTLDKYARGIEAPTDQLPRWPLFQELRDATQARTFLLRPLPEPQVAHYPELAAIFSASPEVEA